MAQYLKTHTRKALQKQLDKSGIAWGRVLDRKTWYEFLEWSQIDDVKHNSLTTLEEWQDEWAEFDAAYDDWKGNY